jgi:hypothetical protein
MNWVKQKRETVVADAPSIFIRQSGIRLSTKACEEYKIEVGHFVEVFLSDDSQRLGLKFSTTSTEDSFAVTTDGGSAKGKNGAYIACGQIARRLKPPNKQTAILPLLRDKDSGILYSHLAKRFEFLQSKTPAKSGDVGVYRYLLDNEAVYIGQGVLRDRFSEEQRKSWNFDDIEYMIAGDEKERFSIESSLLDEFKSINGRLPFYNRIGGKRGG